ncbi:MAG TPA: hypothetical protein VJN90_06775 [Candidatus Acidoferrales bacterium]|nr:hypothetical protein [Candidatus Acidoferrales bacterium]
MKKFRGSVIAIVAVSALTWAALVIAQTERPITDPSPLLKTQSLIYQSPSDERAIGVDVVRLINTAEAEYKHAHGGYATWPELYRSGVIAKHQKAWPQFSNLGLSEGPEVVPGWTLAMITSADNQSYELSLRNLHDRCQFSLFSDQRELIYRGVVIDCGPAVVPAHQ